MARYIDNRRVFPDGYWQGKRCLELGSGCGLVSCVLAKLGARVLATDKSIVLSHLEDNLEANQVLATRSDYGSSTTSMAAAGEVLVQELNWGPIASHPQAPFQVVIAAACLYVPKTVPILLQTLWLMSAPETTVLFCGIVGEGALTAFMEQVGEYFSYTVRDDDGVIVPNPTRADLATRMMVLVPRFPRDNTV